MVSENISRSRCRTLPVVLSVLALLSPLNEPRAQAETHQQALQAATLSDRQRALLTRIEDYLNTIDTVQSRFVQVSSDGQVAEGLFYLSRPGDLRIEYDPPLPILMVTSGSFLVYYDTELKQATHIPIATTPAGILVEEQIRLNDSALRVLGVEENANTVRVTLSRADDPDAGTLTLLFTDAPLLLRQWTVIDAQGIQTDFALNNPRFGVVLDPALFQFSQNPVVNDRR